MRKVFVMIAALALVVASCKKDDDASKTLNYKGAIVKEFKMYVGSDEGGKEVVLSGVTPEKYWSTEDEVKGQYLKFEGSRCYFSGDKQTFEYKFVGDSLMVYVPELKSWENNGLGSITQITIDSYFYNDSKYRNSGEVSLQDVLSKKGLTSLSQMTQSTDTIRWVNIRYTFE